MNNHIKFKPGKNLAMKVPSHQYERTVIFYRDILNFTQMNDKLPRVVFEFGDKYLWIDRAEHLSQSEVWLEIECNHIQEAKRYFKDKKINRRDEIENLPNGFEGFWISSPNDIIHLVTGT